MFKEEKMVNCVKSCWKIKIYKKKVGIGFDNQEVIRDLF